MNILFIGDIVGKPGRHVAAGLVSGLKDRYRIDYTIANGESHLRDRDEEEVRGYRNALKLIHEQAAKLPISEHTILRLYTLAKANVWDAGRYKEKESDIVEKYPDGTSRVRFKTVLSSRTPVSMAELIDLWNQSLRERWIHPLIAMAVFNLDFLSIHPFRDGSGRVSRLLLLLQCYLLGYEVGRYISIERIIEHGKDRYYETLEQCSQGWHEGRHDPWPYINYVLYTFKTAYKEFEERVGQLRSPRGAKTEMIRAAIDSFEREFTVLDIERACPGFSRDMIRSVLREVQSQGKVTCLRRGPGARWRKRGNILKRG